MEDELASSLSFSRLEFTLFDYFYGVLFALRLLIFLQTYDVNSARSP
jgi:hypothetical protein